MLRLTSWFAVSLKTRRWLYGNTVHTLPLDTYYKVHTYRNGSQAYAYLFGKTDDYLIHNDKVTPVRQWYGTNSVSTLLPREVSLEASVDGVILRATYDEKSLPWPCDDYIVICPCCDLSRPELEKIDVQGTVCITISPSATTVDCSGVTARLYTYMDYPNSDRVDNDYATKLFK